MSEHDHRMARLDKKPSKNALQAVLAIKIRKRVENDGRRKIEASVQLPTRLVRRVGESHFGKEGQTTANEGRAPIDERVPFRAQSLERRREVFLRETPKAFG